MTDFRKYSPETLVVGAGRPDHAHDAPVNPPIVLSSTFRGSGEVDPAEDTVYARFDNPTWNGFEEVIAALEGAELPGLVFSSGMAAVTAVMDRVPVGSVILLPKHSYMSSVTVAKDLEARGIARVVQLDIEDTDSVLEKMRSVAAETGISPQALNYSAPKVLLWLESPTNPMLEVADLPLILSEARRLGIFSAVDNTFASPIVQQPLAHGADAVVHSATKYLSGHSDVLAGIVVTSVKEVRDSIEHYRTSRGAIAGPVEAWLALRGVRTLSLRVEKANHSAEILAQKFLEHPAIAEVRYPGLPTDRGNRRAKKQMRGFGSVLCIVLAADAHHTEEVLGRLQIWTPATSLGGVESLVERRRRHPSEPDTIPESLLRLSVGIENVEDLYSDFEQALAPLTKSR